MACTVQFELPSIEEAELYHSSRPGFFSLLTNSPKGKHQKSYRLTDLHRVLPLVDRSCDTWMSQAEFSRPNRRVVNLARIGLLFADLDYYRVPGLSGRPADDVAWLLLEHCRNEGIPIPSLIIGSGQGLQVKWLLEGTIPRHALPRWNACQRHLVDALSLFGADPQAKDASRVLRLVDTVNTKNGQICRVVHVQNGTDNQPLRHNFEELCENLLPVSRWDIEAQRAERELRKQQKLKLESVTGGNKSPLKGFSGSRLAWDRLDDLRKLARLRGGVQEGERMLHLHWQMNFLLLSGATHSTQMWHEAAELARQIDSSWGYNSPELGTLYEKAKAYNAGEKVEFNGKQYPPLYTPRNDTLINLFRITDDEQKELQTIISKGEKKIREKARDAERKGWKQSRAEYEGEAQARAHKARELRAQGMSIRTIAQDMGISKSQVQRYL